MSVSIERLELPPDERDVEGLAELLVDAVASGAAVSFLAPLAPDVAAAWWRRALADARAGALVFVARDGEGLAGCVRLEPAWAPNQPRRAEVTKLLVHRRAQRSGLGARLMQSLEDAARDAGFTLLTLDARAGGAADRLYRRLGWTCAGTIPDFALDPDGRTPHDAVLFYKRLER